MRRGHGRQRRGAGVGVMEALSEQRRKAGGRDEGRGAGGQWTSASGHRRLGQEGSHVTQVPMGPTAAEGVNAQAGSPGRCVSQQA